MAQGLFADECVCSRTIRAELNIFKENLITVIKVAFYLQSDLFFPSPDFQHHSEFSPPVLAVERKEGFKEVRD